MSQCSQCDSTNNLYFCCKHHFCKICLTQLTHSTFRQDPYLQVKCPLCTEPIPIETLVKVFEGHGNFQTLHNGYEKFDCSLCLTEKRINESTYTFCDHLYCTDCLALYITNCIDLILFEDSICCPECPSMIEDEIILTLVGKSLFNSYTNIKKAKQDFTKSVKFILRLCPNCNRFVECEEGASKFECIKCNLELCFRCKLPVHEGNCEMVGLEEEKNKLKCIEEVEINAKYVNCPICNSAILLEGGCNAMKCPWGGCKNTIFCVLCRKVLDVLYI